MFALATRVCRLSPCGFRRFSAAPTGPLAGLRILDLSRILAGPSATMLLGDMGATVVKVERPKSGDDTRRYAPPFLQKNVGEDSDIAAYFSSCNRNKHSIALNFTTPEGQAVIKRLLQDSHVLIENFKTGTLDKYGLGYAQLKEEFPELVYCSVTGFGQTGPYKDRPAYDMLIQAMGGSMSITGVPEGEPMKMGLSMFDLTAGLHAVIGILAALRNKEQTGLGQHVDISMLDVSVALLQNQGMNYLAKKQRQARVGNNHPNVVPYQVMPSSDGHFILTASNDEQFERFCKVAGAEELVQDEMFSTMKARVVNRVPVTEKLNSLTRQRTTAWWLEELEKSGVGCAPILHPDEVFADPQVQARGMCIEMEMPGFKQPVSLIGSPMKFSRTEVNYRMPPPRLGEHTDEVLLEADYSQAEIAQLRAKGCIGDLPEPPAPVEFTEQVLRSHTLTQKQAPAEGTGFSGKTWDNVRSMSVPNAAAYLDERVAERTSAALQKPSPLKGVRFGGGTWDKVRSMSVPNAAAFLQEHEAGAAGPGGQGQKGAKPDAERSN
mmetsp:Transcript_99649/g.302583  ORF Transcript_99649/g.302583 Transcript_99649/m.302583 type:complete len:549 (-) Transcript_99649:143-1789(-)